jgi:2-methylcitrate dehydratase PrpD
MLAREIARFVIGTQFTALPPDVIAKAKGHILDTLGVLIAATAEPLMDILGGFLNDLDSGGNASILAGC